MLIILNNCVDCTNSYNHGFNPNKQYKQYKKQPQRSRSGVLIMIHLVFRVQTRFTFLKVNVLKTVKMKIEALLMLQKVFTGTRHTHHCKINNTIIAPSIIRNPK